MPDELPASSCQAVGLTCSFGVCANSFVSKNPELQCSITTRRESPTCNHACINCNCFYRNKQPPSLGCSSSFGADHALKSFCRCMCFLYHTPMGHVHDCRICPCKCTSGSQPRRFETIGERALLCARVKHTRLDQGCPDPSHLSGKDLCCPTLAVLQGTNIFCMCSLGSFQAHGLRRLRNNIWDGMG